MLPKASLSKHFNILVTGQGVVKKSYFLPPVSKPPLGQSSHTTTFTFTKQAFCSSSDSTQILVSSC